MATFTTVDDFPEYMTTEEASQFLEVVYKHTLRESSLVKMRQTGNGPPFLKRGRQVRYSKELLKEWMTKITVVQTHTPIRKYTD